MFRSVLGTNKNISVVVRRRCSSFSLKMTPIKAALIDLSGTLHVEDQPTAGAVDALQRYLLLDVQL